MTLDLSVTLKICYHQTVYTYLLFIYATTKKNDRSVSKYSCCENLLLQVTDFHRYKIISICSILEFLFCKEVCYEQNAQDEVAVSYICNHW